MGYQPSGIPSVSGLASDPATQAKLLASNQLYQNYVQRQKDAARNNFIKQTAIGAGTFALGPALGGIGAVTSGAPAVSSGVPASMASSGLPMSQGVPAVIGGSAPGVSQAAGRFSLNNLLDLGKLGAGLWGTITGNHANTKATDLARIEQQREFDQQQQMLLAQQAKDKAEKDRVFAESQRQWEADQKFKADQFAASEQDRMRRQQLEDYNLQLTKESEARKAPRRAASAGALLRLQDLLRLGR